MTTIMLKKRLTGSVALLAPLTGIAFVALTGAAAIVGDPNRFSPGIGPHQSGEVIAYALIENHDAARTSAYLKLGGAVFVFFFLGYLRDALRRPDGRGPLASVAFGAGVCIAALDLVGASILIGASDPAGADAAVAKTLLTYGWDYYTVIAAPATAMVAATAIATLTGAPLPRWFGWFSVVVGALLVGLLIGRTAGVGMLAFLAWALVASIAVGLRSAPSTTSPRRYAGATGGPLPNPEPLAAGLARPAWDTRAPHGSR